MTLLSICQDALNEMAGFEVPSTFYGNGNGTAKQCLALVTAEGRDLEKEYRWAELLTEYTFSTVAGTSSYSKPADFRAFANMSQWDRTNRWRLSGPVPSVVWQWLNSGLVVASATNRWFAIRGQYMMIFPTPTSADTLAFDYYSKSWIVKQSDASNTTRFASDNDTCRLDEDLLVLGLKWRFLQAKGMPYEPEYKLYESIKTSLIEDNGGKGPIDLNRRCYSQPGGNLPETGYGQ